MSDLKEARISSEELIDGKLLKAYRDEVELPDGTRSIREWIDHPGASAVVPLFEDGKTLMVRQFRYPPRREFLEVPAGKLDKPGEAPEAVAARELEEETGWKASSFSYLGSLYPCIGYSNEVIHFYLAEGLTRGERGLEEGEHMDVVTIGFDDALARARRGEIHDMKSTSALFLAEQFLHRRDAGEDRSKEWH